MAFKASKLAKVGKTARAPSAADRIKTPPFKPSSPITREQIDEAIRDVMAKRVVQPQS